MSNNIEKEYLNLALPSGFECIIGVLITMTDTFMVSKYGAGVIASVGAMGVVIDFMYLVLQSINVSNNVIVARLKGRKQYEQMKLTTGTALIISVLCDIVCILLVFFVSGLIPKIFNVDKVGLLYLYIRLIGVVPNTILSILSGYQRTLGNSKKMLNVRILCFFLNVIFDVLFISIGFSIVGVSLATVIVEFINMLILIYYCKGLVKVKFVKKIAQELFDLIRYNVYERIFKRGSNFILNIVMSRIGTMQYAAHLIVVQFLDLMNNFMHGTGIGTQTMTATVLVSDEKEKIDRTEKCISRINNKIIYLSTFIISIIMICLLPMFLREKESLQIGYKLVIFVVIDCIFSGFYHYYSSILRAMKEFKFISKLSLIISVFLKVLLAYLFSNVCGIYGVWLCYIFSDLIMNILLKNRVFNNYKKVYN